MIRRVYCIVVLNGALGPRPGSVKNQFRAHLRVRTLLYIIILLICIIIIGTYYHYAFLPESADHETNKRRNLVELYVILLLCSPLILPRRIASGCTTCLLAELSTWKRNINPYKAGVKKDRNMYGGWAFQLDEGRQIVSTRSRRPVPVSRTAPAAAVYRSTVPHNNRIRVHKGEGHVEGQT